ncbi:lytic transglycosylase [Nocardioides sp. Root1257]|uniref:transglycosylase SLT domain-containing protein n=1 Tax=unclassified Nocardioides TaxID=2615069 RepID=UPI0006FC938F|nr:MULTISPECIES: transglycosylase SLT domain-containing protein [unclassified Nocardioides]KQW42572.1 lytic transglycosylase [Nocardioides sp. Root1257]KRC39830.1 lytic transglycosylase [Nocardioides sp. Root224]
MSVSDVTSRISQIQAQIALLKPASSTSSTAFSGALSDATATSTSTTTSTGTAKGDAVVEDARKYLGVPYVWGGTDPDKGLDCSGLVQKVYSDLGYDLPRVSYQQAEAGRPVASLADAQPGDILAFGSPVHHVAIYVGENQMIEAPRPGLDVRLGPIYETPTAIRRVVPDAGTASAGSVGVGGVGGVGTSGRVAAGTPYASLFESAAAKYGVGADLLSAVAKQESGYNPRATSSAGAQGLMQLMPGTAQGLGVTNAFDPAQAVDGAARLLSSLLDRFGSTPLALAAYNAGPGAVLRYDGIPPYAETQNYVRSVMSTLEAA